MKPKKRKCQGCCALIDRELLIKITKLKDNTLKINPSSKELGRSMYVCKNENCVKNVIKKKRIKSALKYSNTDAIAQIEKELLNVVLYN